MIAGGVLDILTVALMGLRSHYALSQLASQNSYGSIAYEYEKNSYPRAMADLLWDDPDTALAFLQQPDPQAAETLGIDLLSGFTLKGQIRKYFHFQAQLDPAYRAQMLAAMDQFTETDPLQRLANPPRKFWERSQDDCDTPVDCRNTDNLRAMRDTSVYLMAETTGNETTRLIYKAHLERYVSTLLDIGMGEWDSPTYHGHTTAAYLNLYDFAQDPEVKQLAKTALDWLFQAAALKYWRGSWNGPAKRVSGRVSGNGAAAFFWLYFGDGLPPADPEGDWIYALTSSYQPPASVRAIAQRRFPKPVELRRTHPHYENWKPGRYGPAFYETLYYGDTFQLGSLAQGTSGDWNGFSLRVLTLTGTDLLTVTAQGSHQIVQVENSLFWYGGSPKLSFPTAKKTVRKNVTFFSTARTWIAIRHFEQGFTLEVEDATGDFDRFQRRILSQSWLSQRPRLSQPFSHGYWVFRTSSGETLEISPSAELLPVVQINGQPRLWSHYRPAVNLDNLLHPSLE